MTQAFDGRIEDREAIREVIALYAHAIDRRRWDMMEKLFHADALFGFGPIEGGWQGSSSRPKQSSTRASLPSTSSARRSSPSPMPTPRIARPT